jgi:hypothetical protein
LARWLWLRATSAAVVLALAALALLPFDVTVATRITRRYQEGDGGPYSETDDAYLYSGAPNTNFVPRW